LTAVKTELSHSVGLDILRGLSIGLQWPAFEFEALFHYAFIWSIQRNKESSKRSRTYKEISNLFQPNFPEVRKGFSERNLHLFCFKHEITKINETEIDAII